MWPVAARPRSLQSCSSRKSPSGTASSSRSASRSTRPAGLVTRARLPFDPRTTLLDYPVAARGIMADKTSKAGKPLGPIGTKVLFENEHIRVWSVELPGKGHQPLHEHDHPYLIVPVSEG